MVISELTKAVREIISNSDAPEFEAQYIVMAAMGADMTEYALKRSDAAGETLEEKAFAMANRRKGGEPLAYILSSAEFMGLTFKVNRGTLIPRADTETLVEFLIEKIGNKKVRVLDIGTGTGCIGISLAHFCPNAEITLLDISENALCTAKENARLNGVFAEFVRCDILREIPCGKFDIIVSNPPYIRTDVIKTLQTEVKDYEPVTALDGGADGLLFYRRISKIALNLLNSGGMLAFETGFDQRAEITKLMSNYADVGALKDFGGSDRVVYGFKRD